MTDKQKAVTVSILVLSTALCGVVSLTMCLLYRTTLRLETQRLMEMVHSHAALLEETARLAKQLHAEHPEDSLRTVMSRIQAKSI